MIIDPATARQSAHPGRGQTVHLSDAGGLTQFGAYQEILPPGAFSSDRHWHSAEDEFLYVLEGHATVLDDDGAQDLGPGDAVAWRHGDPNAHHVTNRTDAPVVYLIVGSRAALDICTYPDSGRQLVNHATTWEVRDAQGIRVRGGELPAELLSLRPAWGSAHDPSRPAPRTLRAGDVTPVLTSNGYPPAFTDLGPSHHVPLSESSGLTQFGAFTETLQPWAMSSQRHWHEAEDEFVYILDGSVTLVDDDGPHLMQPGDAAAWPAGVANGHHLVNRSDRPAIYLVVGTRLPEDIVHYPDVDLHYVRRAGRRTYAAKDGTVLRVMG